MNCFNTAPGAGYREVPSPFAMDGETFRRFGYLLVELAGGYLEELVTAPVYRPMPERSSKRLLPPNRRASRNVRASIPHPLSITMKSTESPESFTRMSTIVAPA